MGRGACLNRELPPDRRGRIHENDIASLREFRRILDATFAENLARGARVEASAERRDGRKYAALMGSSTVTVGRVGRRPAGDGVGELVLDLRAGARSTSWNCGNSCRWVSGWMRSRSIPGTTKWAEIATGTSIGNRRLLRLPAKVELDRVRIGVTQAAAGPALSEVGLYCEP